MLNGQTHYYNFQVYFCLLSPFLEQMLRGFLVRTRWHREEQPCKSVKKQDRRRCANSKSIPFSTKIIAPFVIHLFCQTPDQFDDVLDEKSRVNTKNNRVTGK